MRGLACACVAPKLIANRESHALERSSPARGLRIGQSHGSKAHESGEEGGGLVGGGARARAMGRHDMCSLRRRRSARGAPWRKAPERTRSIPRAKAAQCARVAIAPTHVEHEERRSTKSEEDDSRGALFLATYLPNRGVVHVNRLASIALHSLTLSTVTPKNHGTIVLGRTRRVDHFDFFNAGDHGTPLARAVSRP